MKKRKIKKGNMKKWDMKNWSMRNKLLMIFSSFGILLLAICTVVFFTVLSQSARFQKLSGDSLQAVRTIGEMEERFEKENVLMRDLLFLNPGDEGYESSAKELEESEGQMQALFSQYGRTISSSREKEIFEAMEKVYDNDYKWLKADVKQFADQNKKEEAIQRLLSASQSGTRQEGEQTDAVSSATPQSNSDMMKYMDQLVQINNQAAEDAMRSVKQMSSMLLWVAIPIVLLAAAWIVFSVRYLTKAIALRIVRIAREADQIADGSIDISVEEEDSADEVGQLARAFNRITEGNRRQLAAVQALADGDLTAAVPQRSGDDAMAEAFNRMLKSLGRLISTIDASAGQVDAGASQVAIGAQEMASGAAEQAALLEELSSFATKVAGQAAENKGNIRQAAQHMAETSSGVLDGNAHMKLLTDAMTEIGSASGQITHITKVIEDIAFQTNILALNAAVEAARAGGAGKGFAVVADEVRNLASKSAKAAKQTGELIRHSVQAVEEGSHVAEETAQILQGIEEKANLVNRLIGEVSHASAQQSEEVEEITKNLSKASAVVQNSSATAEQSAAASEELSSQAAMLKQETGRFRLTAE